MMRETTHPPPAHGALGAGRAGAGGAAAADASSMHCARTFWCWWSFTGPSSRPRAGGLALAFFAGLALDVINGVVLGQHALALTLMAAWATHLRLRLRVFSMLSQSLTIFALLTGYQFILFWVDGATGNPVTTLRPLARAGDRRVALAAARRHAEPSA